MYKRQIFKSSDIGLILRVTFIGINAKRDADWITVLIKHLRPDFITTPALTTVIAPSDDKAAIL